MLEGINHMEISLVDEQAFNFIPRFSFEVAHDRIEQKKVNLIAGTLGNLLSRPKTTDIVMISMENRYEPFWLVTISTFTRYDRNHTYVIPASTPEVKQVTILGQDLKLDNQGKGNPTFSLSAVEHCTEEHSSTKTFDGLSGMAKDMSKYLAFPKTQIIELETFSPEGAFVVPPQVRATAAVRQALSETIKPVQQAHVIHEERVNVEAIELNYKPIFALEYEWTGKGKRGVIEFDALTGEISGDGRKLSNQIKGMVTRDLLFDVTADAVGMIVPGGSIAVKLVKAVIDRDK
jgi:hypothetical protein